MSALKQWYDVAGNLHLHTTASDGSGSHETVATAAVQAGLDFIVYTDHNITVEGQTGWYTETESGRRLLRLMGQEVNDVRLKPEHSHLLCYFVEDDLDAVAHNPQQLIDTVNDRGGLTFLAHPLERPGYSAAAQTFPWRHWDVTGYTGIELWNAMSDAKWQMRSMSRALFGAYVPYWAINAPFPEMLAKWDALLAEGRKVVAIGNADAHAMVITWGLLTRVIYPYEYAFRAVNTHLLLEQPLAEEVATAQQQIFRALKTGRCYISNDLIGNPRGFRFTASRGNSHVTMGQTLHLSADNPAEITLCVETPAAGRIRLLRDGRLVHQVRGRRLEWKTHQPGVYRVEVLRWYWGWSRGWLYSNPIYVRSV